MPILAAQRTREYLVLVYGLPSVKSDFDTSRLRKYILTGLIWTETILCSAVK